MQQIFGILRRSTRALALMLTTVILSGLLALPAIATNASEVADISSGNTWILDTSEVLSRTTENKLTRSLKELAASSGQELRVVIFRRLDYGLTIDSFADDLFARWYPDAEGSENKTLLVMDTITNNATVRTGAEALTPEIIESTLEENIGQQLRQGDKYNQAFEAGLARFGAVLSGQPDPGAPEEADYIQTEGNFVSAEEMETGSSTAWVIVLLVLATAIPMATYYGYVLLTRD